MTSTVTVVVGFIGIVIGALLGGVMELVLARRREARDARAVEIGLDGVLRNAEETLRSQLAENVRWWWEDASAPSLRAWDERNEALVDLPPEDRAKLQTTIDGLRDLNTMSASKMAQADEAAERYEMAQERYGRGELKELPPKPPPLEFTPPEEDLVNKGLNQVVRARQLLKNRSNKRVARGRMWRWLGVLAAAAVIAAAVTLGLTWPRNALTSGSLGVALQNELGASSVGCTPVGTSNDIWDCVAAFGLVPGTNCDAATRSPLSARGLGGMATLMSSPTPLAPCVETPAEFNGGLEEWRATRGAKRDCALANKAAATFSRLDPAEQRAVTQGTGAMQSGSGLEQPQLGLQPVLDKNPEETRELCP